MSGEQTIREHLEAAIALAECDADCPCDQGIAHRHILAAIDILNNSAPQCLDNPPGVSHRLVADHQGDAT